MIISLLIVLTVFLIIKKKMALSKSPLYDKVGQHIQLGRTTQIRGSTTNAERSGTFGGQEATFNGDATDHERTSLGEMESTISDHVNDGYDRLNYGKTFNTTTVARMTGLYQQLDFTTPTQSELQKPMATNSKEAEVQCQRMDKEVFSSEYPAQGELDTKVFQNNIPKPMNTATKLSTNSSIEQGGQLVDVVSISKPTQQATAEPGQPTAHYERVKYNKEVLKMVAAVKDVVVGPAPTADQITTNPDAPYEQVKYNKQVLKMVAALSSKDVVVGLNPTDPVSTVPDSSYEQAKDNERLSRKKTTAPPSKDVFVDQTSEPESSTSTTSHYERVKYDSQLLRMVAALHSKDVFVDQSSEAKQAATDPDNALPTTQYDELLQKKVAAQDVLGAKTMP